MNYGTGLLSDLTLKAPETNPVTKSTNGGVITEYEVVKTAGGEKKISGKVYLVVLSAEICETFKVDDDVVIGVSKGKSENPKTKLMAEAVGADDWTATIKLIPDDKSVEILEPTELSKSSNLTNIRITKGYEFEKKETKELELSFKIKGKEVKLVKDLNLLPVEVVDKDKKAATELKVGKMENALTAAGVLDIDKDEDRFFVRIPGGSALKNVSIKLGTVENPDGSYNDDVTEIDMVVDGNDLITKSLLLVSDDIDDDYAGNGVGADDVKNDRTHKVQLGGKVQVKSITIDGKEHQLDMKTDVPAKKQVDFTVVIVKVGGVSVVTKASAESDLKVVQERFAQVAIDLNWTILEKEQPAGVDLTDGFSEFQTNTPTTEEKALIDGLGTAATTDIHAFYVSQFVPNGSYSEAFPPYYFNRAADARYLNNVIIARNRLPEVLAHELVHVVADIAHEASSLNLMYSFGVPGATQITHPRRMTKNQEQKSQNSPLAK